MDLQHIAQELAEEFAPLVIGQSGTTKTFTVEQASALNRTGFVGGFFI